jgi:hypothetical protein
VANWTVRAATRPLPAGHRGRYRQEFLAELYAMTPSQQLHHATRVISRVWTLRVALNEQERLLAKEAAMAKPWRCRMGRRRWQRLRNPEGRWYRECAAAERNGPPTVGDLPTADRGLTGRC